MTLKNLRIEGRKGLKGMFLLFLMVLIPLALGSFGKKAEASTDGASTHEAPAHSGDHVATPAAHGDEHAMSAAGHEAPVHAVEDAHAAAPAHGDEAAHGDTGGHGDGDAAHGGGHHAEPPVTYYANWSVLFLGVIVCGFYLIRVAKVGKPHHETILLAFIFVCMAYFLFISANYIPSMARHFDMNTHAFVDGYHESPLIGFVKFIYRIVFGAFLTVYAIVGMEHH